MQLGRINTKTQKIYFTILLFAIVIATLLCCYFATAAAWAADIDTDDADETYENMKLRVETRRSDWSSDVFSSDLITGFAVIVFIVAGVKNFMKLKSAEDEGEREKTKKAILWWLIGCVGVIVVFWAVPLVIKIAQSLFPSTSL